MDKIAGRVKECREWLGLSIPQAVALTGIPFRRLQSIERADHPPRRSDLAKIVRAYRHPLAWFRTGEFPDGDVSAEERASIQAAAEARGLSRADVETVKRFTGFLRQAGPAPRPGPAYDPRPATPDTGWAKGYTPPAPRYNGTRRQ